MNLSEYILLSQEERQKHIDLSSECILIPRTGTWTNFKISLLQHLLLEDDIPLWRGRIHRCHVCENDTQKKFVCVNPLHLYIGTLQENLLDRSPKKAAAGGYANKGIKRDEDFCRRNRENKYKTIDVSRETTGEFMRVKSQKFAAFILGVSPALISVRLKSGLPTQDGFVFTRPLTRH
jgi:hypothetical protein